MLLTPMILHFASTIFQKESTITGHWNDEEVHQQLKIAAERCGCNPAGKHAPFHTLVIVTFASLMVFGIGVR